MYAMWYMFLYYLCCSVVEMSVKNTDDIWFINFYSPRCSHCHELAPTVSVLVHLRCIFTFRVFYGDMLYRQRLVSVSQWREVAQELEGVVRIGAVNCGDDRMLCRNEGITGYPSLKVYPRVTKRSLTAFAFCLNS